VDDPHFNLAYHVRHTSLPRPGDEEQLKRLSARIMSQQLDRTRPLWEAWIVEGLAGGRFALVTKTHHCMADGLAAVDLLTVLLSPVPDEPVEPAPRWRPRPVPGARTLVRDEVLRRLSAPFGLVRRLGDALGEPARAGAAIAERAWAVWHTISAAMPPPGDTPLNRPIGPHRRLGWLELDLDAVKRVKNRLGGTVNDVVLSTVTGGMRTFLRRRGTRVETLCYRIVVPVSVRAPEERGTASNRASGWLMSLPIGESDPALRHARVCVITAKRKSSKQALGPEALLGVVELGGPLLFAAGVRLTSRLSPYNLIVTNVPGPPVPLYLLGARLLGGYPVVPLFENQGVAIAIFSYLGRLFVGVNADWDLVPDVEQLVIDLRGAFAELAEAAAEQAPSRASG
jgi:diacylglycerol O-acyltransferase / wax synthase